MKTYKELDALKQRIEKLSNEIKELNEDELGSVTGGKTYIFGGPVVMGVEASNMLRGRVPGMNISADGNPSGPVNTTRIASSINSHQDPIYVIDGVIVQLCGAEGFTTYNK